MIESMKVGEPLQDCNVLVVCFAFGCLILVTVAFQMDAENIKRKHTWNLIPAVLHRQHTLTVEDMWVVCPSLVGCFGQRLKKPFIYNHQIVSFWSHCLELQFFHRAMNLESHLSRICIFCISLSLKFLGMFCHIMSWSSSSCPLEQTIVRSRNIAVSPVGGTACEAHDKVEVAPCGCLSLYDSEKHTTTTATASTTTTTTTTNNNKQQQTTTNNNKQQQTTTNNNKQQQTTTNNNKQQQTTTNNNKQQQTTTNNNKQQQTTTNNNKQQQTTTNNNKQQQTTTNNNKQQQTTTNNNKQQQTTTNNNKQQQTTTNNNNNNNNNEAVELHWFFLVCAEVSGTGRYHVLKSTRGWCNMV